MGAGNYKGKRCSGTLFRRQLCHLQAPQPLPGAPQPTGACLSSNDNPQFVPRISTNPPPLSESCIFQTKRWIFSSSPLPRHPFHGQENSLPRNLAPPRLQPKVGKLVARKRRDEKKTGTREGDHNKSHKLFLADFPTLHSLVDHEEAKYTDEQAGQCSYKCREGWSMFVH